MLADEDVEQGFKQLAMQKQLQHMREGVYGMLTDLLIYQKGPSKKGLRTGNFKANSQGLHMISSFKGKVRLEVHHMSDDMIFQ